APRLGRAPRGVEDLNPEEVAGRVVIEDHAGLIFVAVGHRSAAQFQGQRVGLGVIGRFHEELQYLLILLVRYAVATSGGSRSTSTNTRSKWPAMIDCATTRPARTGATCPGDSRTARRSTSLIRRFANCPAACSVMTALLKSGIG